MKFKRIEISAFRIYDKAEHATFDFSIDANTTADFVSLYAPNGYGKTSFYDAVEWGMTNNVQRFWQNTTITKGAIDALKSQSDTQVKLWRNIHSNQPTYVKILGEGIEPINRKLKPHGNKKSDADMDGGENLPNRTFRNVILSQEWISAFLREIDGTKRYEIFMDNPELKEINSYYKNLKALLTYCQGSISTIDQEINKEQERVSALENENILEKINLQIDLLSEKFQQPGLNKLTLTTTKEEVSRLKNRIVDRLIAINDETAIREKLDWILAAKVGSDEYIGIRAYFDLEERNIDIDENQRSIRNILVKFSDADNKTNEIAALNKLMKGKESLKSSVSGIIGKYYEYQRVATSLSQQENKAANLRVQINTKSDDLGSLEIQETETRSELNSALARIDQVEATINSLPDRLLLIQKFEQDISAQGAKVTEERDRLRPLETQFKTVETELQELENEVANINQETFSKNLIEDQVLASNIDVLLANREALSKNEEQLKVLNARITQHETLHSELSAFIRQGLELINKDRIRNKCPLCEQTFKSHQELAERIASNRALDEILQDLFKDKNHLQEESSRLKELINNTTEQLLLYFKEEINDKQILRIAVSAHIQTLTKSISSHEDVLNLMQNDLRELMMQQLGLSNDAYEQMLSSDLEILRKIESQLNDVLKKQLLDKNKLSDLLAKSRDELKLCEETIATLKQSESYMNVLMWFRVNFNTEEVSLEVLQNELGENERLIKGYFDQIAKLQTKLQSLTLELATFNQLAEKERLNSLIEEKERADSRMDGFRHLLKDKLEIESQFIDFKTLTATLDLKEQGLNLVQLSNRSLIDEYTKIEKYANNVNEFLQSENAKIALEQLVADKTFLEGNVKIRLSSELGKTKTFLQEKVKEFFFENLINDLYRKIDPHPDFKEVHFSADFDAETPRLDVFVRDKVNKNIDLIPNLYFSTAQINILSLSIFLATALNTPDYDCIFIDDPIQSMDSVNILSTIDLLRSIVLNYNKQIILSTHDETFFKLLKKKMPTGPFKSKFLELESVGRIKATI
ncbi:hypothetical protein [Mucilaginibacter sp.]